MDYSHLNTRMIVQRSKDFANYGNNLHCIMLNIIIINNNIIIVRYIEDINFEQGSGDC